MCASVIFDHKRPRECKQCQLQKQPKKNMAFVQVLNESNKTSPTMTFVYIIGDNGGVYARERQTHE